MNSEMTGVVLDIDRLGQRGEGVARTGRGLVFVLMRCRGNRARGSRRRTRAPA